MGSVPQDYGNRGGLDLDGLGVPQDYCVHASHKFASLAWYQPLRCGLTGRKALIEPQLPGDFAKLNSNTGWVDQRDESQHHICDECLLERFNNIGFVQCGFCAADNTTRPFSFLYRRCRRAARVQS